jgi:hypothetical protein
MLLRMPTTPSAPHDARRRRALRIAVLRQRVLAASLATFALAFALVAFDGSMGSSTKASATSGASAVSSAAPAPAAAPPPTDEFDDGGGQQQQQQFDDGSGFAGQAPEPVQTSQS